MERFNNRYKRDMKTAIEWLQEALMTLENAPNYNQWAFNKAKEMEKEQIETAFEEGMFHHTNGLCPDEYYNETFKSQEDDKV
jgi:hypothetical protein